MPTAPTKPKEVLYEVKNELKHTAHSNYQCEHSTVHECSTVHGTLKNKRALMMFERHANLKYKYGSRNFWCRGYYVDTVEKNKKMIKKHIKNQLEEDCTNDQISLKEYADPFTGEKRK